MFKKLKKTLRFICLRALIFIQKKVGNDHLKENSAGRKGRRKINMISSALMLQHCMLKKNRLPCNLVRM
mgnify:CR=1 FL=1